MIKWRKTKEKVSETLENVEAVQEETSKNMTEEVLEESLQGISQESAEEITEETVEVSEGISEEELKEISEALEEETTEVSEDETYMPLHRWIGGRGAPVHSSYGDRLCLQGPQRRHGVR